MMLSLTMQIIKTIGSYKEIRENVFQKCNHGYKNVACLYLSNGARWAYSYNYS